MIKIEDIKPGVIVIHKDNNENNNEYTIINTTAKVKLNGIWYNVITYKPNYHSKYSIFARTIDDFINNFSVKNDESDRS